MRVAPAIDPLISAAAAFALGDAETVLCPTTAVADALTERGITAMTGRLEDAPPGSADAVALVAEELSAAGEHGENIIHLAVTALRPGGWLVVSARGAVAGDAGGHRAYSAEELRRTLGHRGVSAQLLCAPGASAAVRGLPEPRFDPELDRLPGLVDAAPILLAAGRAPSSAADRSASFFETLPRKVVAAAVLCRDEDGRLLTVYDSFKRHWTIPGGVVDANEDPRAGAVREAWEEAGVRVRGGRVLGVFSGWWPDRVILVYEATMIPGAEHRFAPIHAHEIDGVRWMDVEEALRLFAPHVADQVRTCLDDPGGSLAQGATG